MSPSEDRLLYYDVKIIARAEGLVRTHPFRECPPAENVGFITMII